MKVGNLVGLVGWRGMVGSVLMDRMQAEGILKKNGQLKGQQIFVLCMGG